MDKTKNKTSQEEIAKAYGEYTKQFTPKPAFLINGAKAFFCGGALCTIALWVNNLLVDGGMKADEASTWVTVGLVVIAQLLTGFGIFDSIAKWAGAGVIVPITGFANSMVATSIEYKKEGVVLGVGSKMFSVAGPVLACGITVATIFVIIRFLLNLA